MDTDTDRRGRAPAGADGTGGKGAACGRKAAEPGIGMMFRGLPAVAAQLRNGHGGTGVSWRHLKMVLKGERESAALLGQVRERFPHLLAPGGVPWNRARGGGAPDGG